MTFMSFPDEYAQSSVVPVLSHVMATTVCLSFSCILYPLDCMSVDGMGIISVSQKHYAVEYL